MARAKQRAKRGCEGEMVRLPRESFVDVLRAGIWSAADLRMEPIVLRVLYQNRWSAVSALTDGAVSGCRTGAGCQEVTSGLVDEFAKCRDDDHGYRDQHSVRHISCCAGSCSSSCIQLGFPIRVIFVNGIM